jgi:hypothetical protein
MTPKYLILYRKGSRVSINCISQHYIHDMDVDQFVAWCRANGTKLRTLGPMVYRPDFRDDAAEAAFAATWMTEAAMSRPSWAAVEAVKSP